MVVEVDRQAQARSLPVKLASLRFGKVIVWLPGSGPRIFRGFSRVRPARGNQTDFCARPADGLVLLAERVGHHQQHSGAIQSESDPTLLFLAVLVIEYRHGSWIEKNRGGPLK